MIKKPLPTVHRLVGEKRYIWCYSVGKFIKGIEEGGFVSWDSGSIQGTSPAERSGCNILQRVTRNLTEKPSDWAT
jgi:hypothetical protein